MKRIFWLLLFSSAAGASLHITTKTPIFSAVSHQFLTAISAGGTVTGAQPAFTDISGSLAGSQLPSFTGDVTNSSAAMTLAAIQGTSITGASGTGNVLLSASPTSTGTFNGASAIFSGLVGVMASGTSTTTLLRVGGGSNPLTGSAQVGVAVSYTGSANATSSIRGIQATLLQANGTGATSNVWNFLSNAATPGTSSSFTNFADYTAVGFLTTTASNVSAFTDDNSASPSFTGSYFLKQVNTTANLLSGPVTMSNAAVKLTGVTTGTNADTLCLKSDGTILIQAAACTISSKRFKENIKPIGFSALDEVMQFKAVEFNMKAQAKPNPDSVNFGRTQIGLIAEDVEKVDSRLAIYDPDGKTPKSYRQEAMIALLVKAVQEQQTEIAFLKKRIQNK